MSTEQAGAVVVQVTAADFGRLCENSMRWAGGGWDTSSGRFEGDNEPHADWRRIYWLGTCYASVIFARAFLAARGFGYEVLFDTATDMGGPMFGYVILTDYEEER